MSIVRYQAGPRMSQAVAAGGLLFTAGQVAAGNGVTAQTNSILAQIDALLGDAGTSKANLVSASIWLADMADFAEFNSVWDRWVIPGATPARATVGAALAADTFRVEIAVIATLTG